MQEASRSAPQRGVADAATAALRTRTPDVADADAGRCASWAGYVERMRSPTLTRQILGLAVLLASSKYAVARAKRNPAAWRSTGTGAVHSGQHLSSE